jgi:hypothetical protein
VLSRPIRIATVVAVACGILSFAGAAAATPITMLRYKAEWARHANQANQAQASGAVVPPPAPCPQNGMLPLPTVDNVGLVPNCGIPELPIAAGEPYPGTMSYYGGHVQLQPREYLVLWGWGEKGAFGTRKCTSENIVEGSLSATLKCDPDGAGKYMANFLYNMGGTQWANVQDQYYEADPNGRNFINENQNMLAGIWVDDSSPGANLQKTSVSNPVGPTHTYTDMALEATRAARHFGVSAAALNNANFIIAQPQDFTDPQSAAGGSLIGYCAFHDYTLFGATGNAYYNPKTGVGQHISYTNMPYNAGQAGCGAGFVNQPGTLDSVSIGLGHEVQETVTDPGAEDVIGNVTSGGTSYYGGWYDTLDANENGDKCAYVGLSPTAGLAGPNILPIPGALGNIKGKHSGTYAVQSDWSDAAAGGTGWCAGIASTDLPAPFSGEPPY